MFREVAARLLELARPGVATRATARVTVVCPHSKVALHAWLPALSKVIQPSCALLVHGLNDYSRYWDKLAPALTEQGLTVVAVDLRGHGYSSALQGPLGFLDSYSSARDNDVIFGAQVAVDLCCMSSLGGVARAPLVLIGSSLGGTLVIDAALRWRASRAAALRSHSVPSDGGGEVDALSLVCGVVAQAPLYIPRQSATPSAAWQAVGALLHAIAPTMPIIPSRTGTGAAYHADVRGMRVAEDAIDGRVYKGRMRVGTAWALLDGMRSLRRHMTRSDGCHNVSVECEMHCKPIALLAPLPPLRLLIQHGTADALVDVSGSERLVHEVASQHCRGYLRLYRDGTHDLLREREVMTNMVVRDVVRWTTSATKMWQKRLLTEPLTQQHAKSVKI